MFYKSCKTYLFTMDSVFLLCQDDLSTFFQQFGCTYLCLWFYSPQAHQSPNCLCYKDGFYIERNTQQTASSSAGTMARRLFNEYRQSIFILDNSRHIPGIAFQNSLPYMELNYIDLITFASTEIQQQFYKEAGIKTAVFLGCNVGEIEMGFSSDTNQVNMEMQIRNWFPEDISRTLPLQPPLATTTDLPQKQIDHQNPAAGAASSSSSLRSYSYDSTADYSPLLFNIPSSSNYTSPEATDLEQAAALRPAPSSFTVPTATPHNHQAMNTTLLSHEQDNRISYVDTVLAVISSSSSHFQPHQNVPRIEQGRAFKRYRQSLAPIESRIRGSGHQRRQNMLKRSISFIRRMNTIRTQEEQIQEANKPSSAQLHHMISERRRREKINDSFQALRSLLPPSTKKDKASVLARTTEYLSSLKAQVAELSKRNQILETSSRVIPRKPAAVAATEASTTTDSSNRNTLDVRITNVSDSSSSSSTSEIGRTVDLHVRRRGENGIIDNVVRLLEFLRTDENVKVMSIQANSTAMVDSISINTTILRLRIEGSEWDESAFQEAVERIFN